MKKYFILLFTIFLITNSITSFAQKNSTKNEPALQPAEEESTAGNPDIAIIDKPVIHTKLRDRLIKEYTREHYGTEILTIVPQVIVVHWTASNKAETAYNWFNRETLADGTLNVCSQFLVDRDGTIYRLAAETLLCRHAIGYNWCAIGIENAGGEGGIKNLTAQQLQANINLIRYLHAKYPDINWVFGHYQQDDAKISGLYHEKIKDYYAKKIDPGPKFMQQLKEELKDDHLQFIEDTIKPSALDPKED